MSSLATAVLILSSLYAVPRLLALGFLPGTPSSAPAASASSQSAGPCALCGSVLPGTDFCPHCGRLSHLVEITPQRRSWIDAVYVVAYPPLESVPEIKASLSPSGLIAESVVFASGDHYDLNVEKKRITVRGKIGNAGRGREMGYSATLEDTFDDRDRIRTREVHGEIQGDPDLFLYRRLDYGFSPAGRLDRIDFRSWYYRGSSDWKKRPSAWVRHSIGEIVLVRESGEGPVIRIETSVREGGRSLRGETEYHEPQSLIETVTSTNGAVDRIVRQH
jgi:hypothetical protein